METFAKTGFEGWIYFYSRFLYVLCLGLQVVQGLDQVTLVNPPEEPLPDLLLEVVYSCDDFSSVQLECVVFYDTGNTSTLWLRQWDCVPGGPKTRNLAVKLPDWLVYRADGIVPDYQGVESCDIVASVRNIGFDDKEDELVTAQDVAPLQLRPFFDRPVKQHQLCLAWSTQVLQLRRSFSKGECPVDEETQYLLSSVFASTGESFGITKTLEPFQSGFLETARLSTVPFPWCMFSMWIFVIKTCRDNLCGVFHHVDSQNNFATPSVFLTSSGQLHVQVKGKSDESSAFISSFTVPLNVWCHISLTLHGGRVSLHVVSVNKEQRTVHSMKLMLEHSVELDDTDGYFVIGGGTFINGMEGYFGPLVYYRNRISPQSMSEVVVPDVIRSLNLTGWIQTCEAFQQEMAVKLAGYSLKAAQEAESETCVDVFHSWTVTNRLTSRSQSELWKEPVPCRRQAEKLAKFLAFKYKGRKISPSAVGRALYSLSLRKLKRAHSTGSVSRILPLLLQAGCLADNRALHMSSVLYSTGLGVQERPRKAWLLSLLAAQNDDRLALLLQGHVHHWGRNSHPPDPDLAYAYYANIAKRTTVDSQNPSPQQTYVEAIYLNDDEVLGQQTSEDHHIFQWLKFQANRGTTEAERAMGRMLFWGQQGVSRNIQKAVTHFERGAVHWGDPVSMYDYAIVLLQGQGVERDIPKAVSFLKKAMEQEFVPAMNALAWYYEQYEKDYKQAVQLWEQADALQSPDAALNLGVMYASGLYPGKAADQFMAYKYYLKAAERGHIRGAVQLASIWTTGIPGHVHRRPEDAVLWVKWAAEHNGYLGSILRTALDSYLSRDMLTSLLFYMMAAESGYAPAQFNVAYLCEQHMLGFLDAEFASECTVKYYNLTIQSQNPDTYAFTKLGDLLYEGRGHRHRDLKSAAEMYSKAALSKEPQGLYNLGLLVEEGFKLPLSVLVELGLSELYLADDDVLLTTLYRRCRDSENTDSYVPCSLALFKVYVQSLQKEYSSIIELPTVVAVVAAPTLFLIIIGAARRFILSHS